MSTSNPVDVSLTAFKPYLYGVKASNTAHKYLQYTKTFLRLMDRNGYERFNQIPPGFLATFASMLTSEGKAPSTVRVQVFAVKKYLEWVEQQGVPVVRQVVTDLPKPEKRVRDALSPTMFTAYFRQVDLDLQEPIRTATMLLPCSGLRGNEMVSLRITAVRRAVVELKNGKKKKVFFLRVVGKGNKERNVPLMEEGVQILVGYLTGWRSRQQGPWLFPKINRNKHNNSGKKHISDRYLRLAVQKLRESLHMEFTPHTMRRTYITTLYRKGINLKVIAEAAGHSNVQTTIDHYIVPEENDAVRALQEAGSMLSA